jgi:uncharacterized protein YjdB
MAFFNKRMILLFTNLFLLAGIGTTIANYSNSTFEGEANSRTLIIDKTFLTSVANTSTVIPSADVSPFQINPTATSSWSRFGSASSGSYHIVTKLASDTITYSNIPELSALGVSDIDKFFVTVYGVANTATSGNLFTVSALDVNNNVISGATTNPTFIMNSTTSTGTFQQIVDNSLAREVELSSVSTAIKGFKITHTTRNANTIIRRVKIEYIPAGLSVPVEEISVSLSNPSIIVGSTTIATAAVLPENASNKTVSWTSSDLTVATVNSSSGVVTGVAAGTANIIATAQDGSNITAQAAITVSNQPVTGIVVSLPSPFLAVGSYTTATAAISPENATSKTIAWSSLQTNIATINSSTGVITGVALGTATIRATAQDGSGVTGETTITIANNSLYRSYNFLDGGSSSNSAYAETNVTTNVSYASDNPTGTSGTTSWEFDYANLSLTNETRIGGKLLSTVQTDNSTAWANFKTNFVIGTTIDVVKIYGAYKFGTAGNTTKVYLQKSQDGVTWITVQELNPPSATNSASATTLTFVGFTIESNRYIRVGIDLTADANTNSGLAFTKLGIHSYTLC